MSDEDDGFNVRQSVREGAQKVSEVYRTVLGVEREQYVCETCQEPCEPAHTHDPNRMAFDGGESPSWYCDSCDRHFVREVSDESYTMDLYGRDPPQ